MSGHTAERPKPALVGTQPRSRFAAIYLASLRQGVRHRSLFDQVQAYCMFVGYPRSGHSLVGSLLDAHPDVVIAHELDVLRLLRFGFRRNQLYALILANDRSFTKAGRAWTGSDYNVPGQWQGAFRALRVIGDKKGGQSTRRLHAHPWLLERLRRTVRVPLRVVNVIRNPYDNISSMKLQLRGRPTLEGTLDEYFGLCDAMVAVKRQLGADELFDLRYESLVAHPAASLRALYSFLGVADEERYVGPGASVVSGQPSRSRSKLAWSPTLVREVERRIPRYEFLSGYSFED
jgi:hypothetical protein